MDIAGVIPHFLLLASFLGVLVLLSLTIKRRFQARASKFGYSGILVYFRADPRGDAEKRDAIDLSMQGVVLCLLGILFFPLMLIGVFPLYYGMRKLILVALSIGSGFPPDVQ
ncbi:MAG: hypothetical protein WD971_04955 [Pirellulales bacterium]